MKTPIGILTVMIVMAALPLAFRVSAQSGNAATGQQTTAASAATAPAGNGENGKKLFAADGCYQCHGYEGQGAGATGPRLAPGPLPFAQLSKYVRAPTGQMPPYTVKVVPDADLADIYAYLRSRAQPPPVDGIPQLR